MMSFENVGFSRDAADGKKYLLCADCELGPIGIQTLDGDKVCFDVAMDRVRYKDA